MGVRVKFVHPQYFARFVEPLFKNDKLEVEIYDDRVTFFDYNGVLDSQKARHLVNEICQRIEEKLRLQHGELFSYDFEGA